MKSALLVCTGILAVTAFFVLNQPALSADKSTKPSVELGKKLFNDPSLGTNGKSCATCHASDDNIAKLANKKVWFGGGAKTLEQAINFCINGPLAGKPLPEDSVEAKSIAMYMKSLIN